MKCRKGGVFLQFYGWMDVEELLVDTTSNSFYMKSQRVFAENDKYIPFVIILGKGY